MKKASKAGKPVKANKLQKAARAFAVAWAEWHNNDNEWLGDDLIDTSHALVRAAGLEMFVKPGYGHLIREAPKAKGGK